MVQKGMSDTRVGNTQEKNVGSSRHGDLQPASTWLWHPHNSLEISNSRVTCQTIVKAKDCLARYGALEARG